MLNNIFNKYIKKKCLVIIKTRLFYFSFVLNRQRFYYYGHLAIKQRMRRTISTCRKEHTPTTSLNFDLVSFDCLC